MKLTMLKVSIPVLVMMLFQSGDVLGMTPDQSADLMESKTFSEFLSKTYVLGSNVEVIGELTDEERISFGKATQEEVTDLMIDAAGILINYLPKISKDVEDFLERLLDKSDKNKDPNQISEEDVNSMIQDYRDIIVNDFFDKYWKVNEQISSAIQSWKDDIGKWTPGDAGNSDIFRRVITGDIQIQNDRVSTINEYFNMVNNDDADDTCDNPTDEELDKNSESRTLKAYGALVTNYLNRAGDSIINSGYDVDYIDRDLVKQYLEVSLFRDVDSDINAYTGIISEIVAEHPVVRDDMEGQKLWGVTHKVFGKHFANFIGSSSMASEDYDWIEW